MDRNSIEPPFVNIVLVTKGREIFLAQLLKSFDLYVLNPKVRFIIINNGASHEVSLKLASWVQQNNAVSTLIRWETNHPEPSFFWEYLSSLNLEWCWFPSDDDELLPGFVEEFHDVLALNPALLAFSGAALAMDIDGRLLNENLHSPLLAEQTPSERMVTALHECPFLWPATIFNISKLPPKMPPSRYVFDWVVGLNSLIRGQVYFSKAIGLKYRRHADQESSIAPLSRKFFEALIHIGAFAESAEFVSWLEELSSSARLEFFAALVQKGPIYSDPHTGQILIFNLYRLLVKIDSSNSLTLASYHLLLAAKFGTLLSSHDLIHFGIGIEALEGQSLTNYSFQFVEGTCKSLINLFPASPTTPYPINLRIACYHSKKFKRRSYPVIDCTYLSLDATNSSDKVKMQVVEYLIKQGTFDERLSSGEKKLVNFARRVRPLVPKFVLKYLQVWRTS